MQGTKSKTAKAGLENMKILLNYCDLYNCKEFVSFDLSLARGLVSILKRQFCYIAPWLYFSLPHLL